MRADRCRTLILPDTASAFHSSRDDTVSFDQDQRSYRLRGCRYGSARIKRQSRQTSSAPIVGLLPTAPTDTAQAAAKV
jgi:hypothetical protein